MQAELVTMKEKIEELTLDLELLRNEISEKGKFGIYLHKLVLIKELSHKLQGIFNGMSINYSFLYLNEYLDVR